MSPAETKGKDIPGDNVDHNVKTPDGQNTFHGMHGDNSC